VNQRLRQLTIVSRGQRKIRVCKSRK